MSDVKPTSLYPKLPVLNLSFDNTRYSCTPMLSCSDTAEIRITTRVGLFGDEVVHRYSMDLMRQLRNDKRQLPVKAVHEANLRYLNRIVGRMLHDAGAGYSELWPVAIVVQLSPDLEAYRRSFDVEEWQLILTGLVSGDVLAMDVEADGTVRGKSSIRN